MPVTERSLLGAGERVHTLRVERRLTISDLAQHSGVSADTIAHIERGRHKARPETIYAIAKGLGVSFEAIVEPPVIPKRKLKSRVLMPVRIRSKTQVVFYSKLIVYALEEALDTTSHERHHNKPPPDLVVDDEKYLQELRNLVAELKRLNDLLETHSLKSTPKKPVIELRKHLNTFLNRWAGTVGVGAGVMTLGAIAALLHQLGMDDAIFEQLQKKLHIR
jgi:transcriptional regulator with XRE-family HTH domain